MASTTENKTPAQIEADIRATRSRISEEVDALGNKVSPDNLAENAKDAIHSAQEAVVGSVQDLTSSVTDNTEGLASSLVDVVKSNPLPAALIGLGIGLLAAGGASAGRSGSSQSSTQNSRSWAGPSVPVNSYGAGHYGASNSAGTARYSSNGLTGSSNDFTPDPAQLPKPGDSSYSSSNPLSGVADSAGGLVDNAGSYARSAKTGLARMLDEQPLVVGGVAIVAALAIGLSLPTTRQEDQLMGEASDELINTARMKAQDTFEVAKTTVQETVGVVKDEVETQLGSTQAEVKSTLKAQAKEAKGDLSGKLGEAKGAVKSAAKKAKTTAKKTAKKEASKRNLSSTKASSKSTSSKSTSSKSSSSKPKAPSAKRS